MSEGVFIHPTAVVEDGAQLGAGVHVGPFSYVAKTAQLGDRVRLIAHASVLGITSIGEGCVISPNAVLGDAPQSLKHGGGPTRLEVGRNCVIREGATFNTGSDTSRGVTTVGDNGFFMANSHVAHDCIVGNNVTMANNTALGGHAEIGDFVTMGGLAAVHQFVRVGHHAFIGGYAAVVGDVIPYGMAVGDRAKLRGLNVVGIKRSGMTREQLKEIRAAYKMLFDPARPLADNIAQVAATFPNSAPVLDILSFLQSRDKRYFTVPPVGRRDDQEDDA